MGGSNGFERVYTVVLWDVLTAKERGRVELGSFRTFEPSFDLSPDGRLLAANRGGDFGPNIGSAVGLFGAIEIRFHAGPVLFGRPYHVEGEVVAVGESPKTEYVWYDTRATHDDGKLVASMRMQLRWMKASSPLYAEA